MATATTLEACAELVRQAGYWAMVWDDGTEECVAVDGLEKFETCDVSQPICRWACQLQTVVEACWNFAYAAGSRRALALTVTSSVSSCRKQVNIGC